MISKDYYYNILASIDAAIIVTDLSGTITFWNSAAERLYGWPEREVMGRNILTITPSAEMLNDAAEIMSRLVAGKSWSGKFIVKDRNGESFPVYVTDSPLINSDGELVGVVGISFRVPRMGVEPI